MHLQLPAPQSKGPEQTALQIAVEQSGASSTATQLSGWQHEEATQSESNSHSLIIKSSQSSNFT